ncbi:MAG: serine/threonine protein kinase [Planctomycetes bacterium]|nr:serine/threonine protein kinase [Planctomycetota bacterium]
MAAPPDPSSRRVAAVTPPAPDADALQEDLTARFEFGPALGRGGFGAVHRARDRVGDREVALKLLLEPSPAALDRFLREAAVAAALDHPGIVKVHAVGRYAGRPAIVYALVEGGRSLADAARTLDARGRAALVRDAARAVGHAHARGVVHRDLKPDNVLVDPAGRARVADFGLASFEGADRLTRTGGYVGTPTHMAPEQLAGGDAARAPTVDVWSLGVVLYDVLTGRLPFEAPNLMALAGLIDAGRFTAPRAIDATIPRALEAVCLRALQRDPARRYPDALALADALDEALGAGRPAGRRRAGLAAAALAVVAAAGVVAWRGPSEAPAGATPATGATGPRPAAPPAGVDHDPRALATPRASEGRWAVFAADDLVLTGAADDDLRLIDLDGRERRRWAFRAQVAARAPGRGVVLISGQDLHVLSDLEAARVPDRSAWSDLGDVPHFAWTPARSATVTGTAILLLSGERWGVDGMVPMLEQPPHALALSGDGALLAAGVAVSRPGGLPPTHPVRLWEVTTEHPTQRRDLDLGPTRAERLLFVGDRLVAGTTEGALLALDPSTGDVVTTFAGSRGGAVRGLVASPDGRVLHSVRQAPRGALLLEAWDVATGRPLGPAVTLPGAPRGLDLSPDGRRLAIATDAAEHAVHVVPAPGRP